MAETMMQYEIAVLYHPGLEVDLSKAEERIKKIFSDNGAKVKSTDNWGKKKLAYPINNEEHAIYVFYTVEMPPEGVNKVEGMLNITDEVIRYLIVRQDEKELAKAQAAIEAKEKVEKDQKERENSTEKDKDDAKDE